MDEENQQHLLEVNASANTVGIEAVNLSNSGVDINTANNNSPFVPSKTNN